MFEVDYVDSCGAEISKPMVLHSAAGYYIGTLYREDGFEGPQERLSAYYPTYEAAEKDLPAYKES